jgi:hypothetical protein
MFNSVMLRVYRVFYLNEEMERVKIEQSKREVVVNIKDYLKLKKMRAKKDGGKGKVKD